MAVKIEITAAQYKLVEGHPVLELEINGQRREFLAEEFKLLPLTGYVLLEGFGLPVITLERFSPSYYKIRGQLSNDEVLLRLAQDFLDASLSGSFKSFAGKTLPIPAV